MKRLFSIVLLLGGYASAQVPVILMPTPKPQYFDTNGNPLAFGCVFTYAAGTTTPIATYTDSTGTVQNANPVVLSASGFASIWIQAGVAYRIKVVSSGGINCVSGSMQYTVDGVGAGITTLTTTVASGPTPIFTVAAQNQLFKFTLTGDATSQPLTAVGITPPGLITFEITQDASGGHAFTWPSNSIGGCTIVSTAFQTTLQHFIWDGFNAIATGPCVVGNGPAIDTGPISGTSGVFSGALTAAAFISAAAHPASAGAVRLALTDLINWRNSGNTGDEGLGMDGGDHLTVNTGAGLALIGPLPNIFLGGGTASFPLLKRVATQVQVRLADDSADAPLSASTVSWNGASGPTLSGTCATGNTIVASSSTALGCAPLPATILAQSTTATLTNSSFGNTNTTIITKTVTMPATGCPCRVFASWWVYLSVSGSGQDVGYVSDGTAGFAGGETATPGSASGFGLNGTGYSTIIYANSAPITFNLVMAGTHSGSTTVSSTQLGTGITGAPLSSLNLVVYGSN